ncbi:MurR/RpiR family transcriptional regulator [Fictibacillus gelatini]|uniref:MurR/RpiR family transcriptional regulator n=1 Tax=Fictibacillus gelatini TaxID=225985 RepID=UPI0003F5037A|nr:MurR/RpiR family transcriptional regulator [Fictibacillus gelatini]
MASGGLKMVQKMLDKLPASEQKIAEYILEHPHEVVNSTVSQLANVSNTSGAAVIRLCKSLGLKGFQDLKIRVAGDLVKPAEQGYRDIEPSESMYQVAHKTASNAIQSLKETAELINYDELQKAIEALLKAKNVHFFGIGASSIIALDAQQKFLRINKGATAFTDVHLVATLIANADQDDVVFGISFSGETPEVINVLSLAKDRGVQTISLTKFDQTTLSSIADISLFTSYSNEAPFRSAATSSRLAQLYIIDVLFLCIAARQYEETVKHIDKTREAIHFITKKK